MFTNVLGTGCHGISQLAWIMILFITNNLLNSWYINTCLVHIYWLQTILIRPHAFLEFLLSLLFFCFKFYCDPSYFQLDLDRQQVNVQHLRFIPMHELVHSSIFKSIDIKLIIDCCYLSAPGTKIIWFTTVFCCCYSYLFIKYNVLVYVDNDKIS